MRHLNPLVALGIPKSVLVHELARSNRGRIVELAEAKYRLLSKRYHPDLPDGDSELMTGLSEAIAEVRDPDALMVYIDELIETADLEALYQQKITLNLAKRDISTMTALAAGFGYIDQYEVLGIDQPTTILVTFHTQRAVIDVTSPWRAQARVTDASTSDFAEDFQVTSAIYDEGLWHEVYSDDVHQDQWQTIKDFKTSETVRLAGFVATDYINTEYPEPAMLAMIESDGGQPKLDWTPPENCWFLSALSFDSDSVNPRRCVLFKHGRFAITGRIISTWPMEVGNAAERS